ncbi:MAG: hypothetical protein A2068_10985 [Ignavibacteria bacterium GWB2_35_6b]|nr:MAG: hypothetical protein A2068_10985 [Ignavibacteria bacterium GWB2_35_6b]
MKREKISSIKTGIITITLFLLISQASISQSLSNNNSEDIVENVNYTISNGDVFVKYDLLGDSDQLYKVSVVLKSESSKDLTYTPRAVSGDIGEGHFAGKNKQIVWKIKNDFPNGLPGDDFYFVVQAEKINESSNIIMWAGIGVAAVAAAITYIIVGGNESGNPGSSFPPPPGRP